MKNFGLMLLLLAAIIGLQAYPVKITSWQIKDDVKRLNQMRASIDYVNQSTQTIIAYVADDLQFNELLASGFRAERIPDRAKEYADSLWNETKDSRDPLRSYLSLAEYTTFMENTAAQYPSICQLIQFGTSVQGNPLYFMKISDNVTIQENEPEFRYLSSMHGDEVVGYDLCIRLIQLLTSQYSTDARVTNLVNNMELWICPMFNPDGYLAHERYNHNGADLNRNYALPVGSQHPDGMAWQPENIALMDHSNAQNINFSVNFHGGDLVTNYPWDYTYALTPDNELFIQASLAYASHNQPMYTSTEFTNGITNGAAWYIVLGSLQDWVYFNNNDMDLTIEVGYDKWPASSSLDTYWNQNQESILSLLEFAQRGVYGTVTNAQGAPLQATIHLSSSGVNVSTDPDVGDYHRILLPGNYTLTISSPGYQTIAATVTVTSGVATMQNFVLQPVVVTAFSGTLISQNGVVIAGAQISLNDGDTEYSCLTDTQGAFSLASIPAGVYQLIATKTGTGNYVSSFTLEPEDNRQIIVMPNPIFADYFENGLGNWTVQSPWGLITQTSNHVLTDSPAGNYNDNANLTAVLNNPVSLFNLSNPYLSFEIKYSLEATYDYLYVYGSSDGNAWTALASYTGIQNDWMKVNIPLTDYQNGNFYLKFRLNSDSGVTADGVYLDNVVISGLPLNLSVYGDLDSNWLINHQDINDVLEYSVGNDPIPLIDPYPWESLRLEAADLDNDGLISATDAYYINDRINSYASAFPAQGGNLISFLDVPVSITAADDTLLFSVVNPANLKAMTFTLTGPQGFDLFNLIDLTANDHILIASNLEAGKISFLVLNPQDLDAVNTTVNYYNPGNVIHCTGLINDNPFSQDIYSTANNDQTLPTASTQLLGLYPNPFKQSSFIKFTLKAGVVNATLQIFNIKGQLVNKLSSDNLTKGLHNIMFDGNDSNHNPLANGVYFCRLVTPESSQTIKMLILR